MENDIDTLAADKIVCAQVEALLHTIKILFDCDIEHAKIHAKSFISSYRGEGDAANDVCVQKPIRRRHTLLGKRDPIMDEVDSTDIGMSEIQRTASDPGNLGFKDIFNKLAKKAKSAGNISVSEMPQKIAIKLFSLSAGIITRFPMNGYNTENRFKSLERVKKDIAYMGHHHSSEVELLKKFNQTNRGIHIKNSMLFFNGELNATPDALCYKNGSLESIVEIKSHIKELKGARLENENHNGKKQLAASIVASGAKRGYLAVDNASKFTVIELLKADVPTGKINKHLQCHGKFKRDSNISKKEWENVAEVVKRASESDMKDSCDEN